MRPGPAQNESAPTPPRRRDDASRPRGPRRQSAAVMHQSSDNRSTSEAAFEHHSSRLGALHPQPIKIRDLNGLAGFGSSRSDGRRSPPAVSPAYLSAAPQGVKAESAGFIEVFAISRRRASIWITRRPAVAMASRKRPPHPSARQNPAFTRKISAFRRVVTRKVMRKAKLNVLR